MKRITSFLAALLTLILASFLMAVPAHATVRVLYLSFDDGPSIPANTRAVLAALAHNNAKATFFMLGEEVRQHPITYMRVVNAEHEIANHSYNHPNLTRLSSSQIRSQLSRTQSALGAYKGKCWRPPYGSTNARVDSIARNLGLRKVMWGYSTSDWQRPALSTLVNRIVNNARDGRIMLFHDGGNDGDRTAQALEIALPKLRAKGYIFKVVPNCS